MIFEHELQPKEACRFELARLVGADHIEREIRNEVRKTAPENAAYIRVLSPFGELLDTLDCRRELFVKCSEKLGV